MILTTLFVAPLAAGAAGEYAACRFPRRRFWRYLPPVGAAAVTAAVAAFRYHGWSVEGDKAPIETLLLFPGLPALGLLLGMYLGWRLWKRLWSPRVVKDPGGTKDG